MLSGAWKWIKDNKWKSMAAVAVAGGYLWYRTTNQSQSEQKLQKQKMTTYWRDSQIAADSTISQFIPILAKHIEQHTQLFDIVASLRKPDNDLQAKNRLFKELKTQAFAAHLLHLYSVTFVANYMRISVNVVGRHLYAATQSNDSPSMMDVMQNMLPRTGLLALLNGTEQDPQRKLEEPGLLDLSPEIRDKCLGSSEHFLNVGLSILADVVLQACVGALENHALDEKVSLGEVVDIFLHIRNVVEGQFWRSWEGRHVTLIHFLLMPPEDTSPYSFGTPEEAVFSVGMNTEDKLRLLQNEQRNVLESAAFQSLFQHSLNIGFAAMSESIAKTFPKPPAAPQQDETEESKATPVPDRITFAKLVPALSNHFKSMIDPKDNLLTERITGSNDFNEFSYRVFHGPLRNDLP